MSIHENLFRAGTVTYTLHRLLLVGLVLLLARLSLAVVSGCLLPVLEPILLDQAGASAAQIAVIIGTLPNILNAVLCPIISTISDKTRSRWGRRTPYLLFSAPLLGFVLILMGYTNELASGLQYLLPEINCNFPLIILGILICLFQVAYLFPGSVVYYLEADLIPPDCFGRYMAFASIGGALVTGGFNFFVTQYVFTHMRLILFISAAGYVMIYVLQALFAKEGEYPPVHDKLSKEGNRFRHALEYCAMFFRQCFCRKIYVFLALSCGLNSASTVCRGIYNLLFATKDLGVSVALFGKITAISGFVSAALVYFAGKLMDKTHPMLIFFLGGVLVIFTNVFAYFFVWGPTSYGIVSVITALVYAFQNLASIPLMARIFPPDKFGQFCSGHAMVTHVTMIAATALAGLVTEAFGYRIMFVWDFFITILAMLALGVVYQEWKHYGGKNYKAPEVD